MFVSVPEKCCPGNEGGCPVVDVDTNYKKTVIALVKLTVVKKATAGLQFLALPFWNLAKGGRGGGS